MKGKVWLVSRHQGTLEWFKQLGIAVDEVVSHLDSEALVAGDTVAGTLPIQMVAALNERGIRYRHLSLTIPVEWRGRELTLAEIEACEPTLEYFTVVRGTDDE